MNVAPPLSCQAAALNRPAVRQPARRPGSLRRTGSLQTFWTQGEALSYMIMGRARDVSTPQDGAPFVVGEDAIKAEVGPDGRLVSLVSDGRDGLASFAGLRPGGELRKALARDMPEEGCGDTRLHRLLDDLAGASFMSVAAWYAWDGGIAGLAERSKTRAATERPVEGVCLSYFPGSPVMTKDGRGIDEHADHPIGPLPLVADDPLAFHPLLEFDGPNQWRLRRTDIWREGRELVVDAWFQDSSAIMGDPARRVIFHEYGVVAHIDADSLALNAISVTPHVLPYITCHAAPATALAMLAGNVRDFRELVPALLRKDAGCTHLNDMLRSLQDVAGLAGSLSQPMGPGAASIG